MTAAPPARRRAPEGAHRVPVLGVPARRPARTFTDHPDDWAALVTLDAPPALDRWGQPIELVFPSTRPPAEPRRPCPKCVTPNPPPPSVRTCLLCCLPTVDDVCPLCGV